LYHALLHDDIAGVTLEQLPASHREGGYILGILRELDIPEALGLLAPRPAALVNKGQMSCSHWARRAYERLGVSERLLYVNGSATMAGLNHMFAAASSPEKTSAL
jgi:hypothetical protein